MKKLIIFLMLIMASSSWSMRYQRLNHAQECSCFPFDGGFHYDPASPLDYEEQWRAYKNRPGFLDRLKKLSAGFARRFSELYAATGACVGSMPCVPKQRRHPHRD